MGKRDRQGRTHRDATLRGELMLRSRSGTDYFEIGEEELEGEFFEEADGGALVAVQEMPGPPEQSNGDVEAAVPSGDHGMERELPSGERAADGDGATRGDVGDTGSSESGRPRRSRAPSRLRLRTAAVGGVAVLGVGLLATGLVSAIGELGAESAGKIARTDPEPTSPAEHALSARPQRGGAGRAEGATGGGGKRPKRAENQRGGGKREDGRGEVASASSPPAPADNVPESAGATPAPTTIWAPQAPTVEPAPAAGSTTVGQPAPEPSGGGGSPGPAGGGGTMSSGEAAAREFGP